MFCLFVDCVHICVGLTFCNIYYFAVLSRRICAAVHWGRDVSTRSTASGHVNRRLPQLAVQLRCRNFISNNKRKYTMDVHNMLLTLTISIQKTLRAANVV